MSAPDIPRPALEAAAEAIASAANFNDGESERWESRHLARAALQAAAPLLERSIRRTMAREILDLAEADAGLSHINKGPWGDVEISVRRLARGEPLPGAKDLRGGGHGC